jgi:hypothetical protein
MEFMVKYIQKLLAFILMLGLVGCNLPSKSTPPPSIFINLSADTPSAPSVEVTLQGNNPRTEPINVFGITIYTLDNAGGLPQAAQAGTHWTRNGFIWNTIEPSPGDRNWNSELDQELINARSLGVEPIMLIEGTPDWALKPGFNCGAVAQEKFPALASFAYDLVKRYSVPPYNIRYWELWNEPDAAGVLGCWGDPSDTQYYGGYYYGQMLQAVYPRIKEADSNAQVLVGGLLLDCDPDNPPASRTCVESKFLNGILESGAGAYFDGVSFHAYDFYTGKNTYDNPNWNSSSSTTGPVSIAKAHYLKKVLSTYGYAQKYLVNTENAVFWGPNVMDPPCSASPEEVPDIEATNVTYIVQSYAVAVAEEWIANVWYSAFGVRCSGLLNNDLSPKSGYNAYQFTQQELGEAIFIRQINEYKGVMGYEYKIPEGKLLVIWAMDGQAHTIALSDMPTEVNTLGADGHQVQLDSASSLVLKDTPYFIQFEK